jgi:hypothetical protein
MASPKFSFREVADATSSTQNICGAANKFSNIELRSLLSARQNDQEHSGA